MSGTTENIREIEGTADRLHAQVVHLLGIQRGITRSICRDADLFAHSEFAYRLALEQVVGEMGKIVERFAREKVFDFARFEAAYQIAVSKTSALAEKSNAIRTTTFLELTPEAKLIVGVEDLLKQYHSPDGRGEKIPAFLAQARKERPEKQRSA